MAKIDESTAREILRSAERHTHIARRLGISRGIVESLRNGRSWKHLIEPETKWRGGQAQ